jgi:hypothetical protein
VQCITHHNGRKEEDQHHTTHPSRKEESEIAGDLEEGSDDLYGTSRTKVISLFALFDTIEGVWAEIGEKRISLKVDI